MNIFYVDRDPFMAAYDLCDKHVVKMVLETAQLLSTAHRVLDGKPSVVLSDKGRKITRYTLHNSEMDEKLYQATHINHPSSIWARSIRGNYIWLSYHFDALLTEYSYRYERRHKCADLKPLLWEHPLYIQVGDFFPPPLAMPDEYKISTDHVECYREYYRKGKAQILTWKKTRNPPLWL